MGSRRLALRTHLTRAIPLLVLIAAGIIAYANSFNGVFLYDDIHHILEDERIRQLWPPGHLWTHRRPVVIVSLAINYALGGFDPWGYHLFNLIVHLGAGLTLYGLVRRTLAFVGNKGACDSIPCVTPVEPNQEPQASPPWVALTVALLWMVHPLQTQSVTYVIQRGESLMGLFYLLVLYGVVRGASAVRYRRFWYVVAIIACALGMGSKAVMLTAPVMAILFDRVFLTGSFRVTLRRRWPLYAGLAACWGVLLLTGVVQGTIAPKQAKAVMGFGYAGATPWTYLLTQAEVIPHYLRLALWPHPLCLDYAWPFAHGLGQVVVPGSIVVILLGLTVWAMIRHPKLGFLGVWFFLILGPTSSIVPIQDPAYEHRMYLPLAAVIVLVVIGARALINRLSDVAGMRFHTRVAISILLTGMVTTALILGTIQRNKVYADDLTMWQNVTTVRPDNARAFYNLGNALRERGDLAGARAAYERAVQLNPKFVMAQNNLGNILRLRGAPEAAVAHLRRAVREDPDFAEGYVNLGAALADIGRQEEALEALRRACALDRTSPQARFNLAMTLGATGRFDEAIDSFDTSIKLMEETPTDPKVLGQAYYFLGITLARVGRRDEAVAALRRAVSINPRDDRASAALDSLLP